MSLSMHYYFPSSSSSLKHKNSSNVSLNTPATSPFVFEKNSQIIRLRCFSSFPEQSKISKQFEVNQPKGTQLRGICGFILQSPSSPWRATLTWTRPSRLMSVKQVPGANESNASRWGSKVSIETVPRHVVLPLLTQTRYYPGGTVTDKRKSSLCSKRHMTSNNITPTKERKKNRDCSQHKLTMLYYSIHLKKP